MPRHRGGHDRDRLEHSDDSVGTAAVTRRLGFDALTVAEMSVGSAAIGSAFSPMNPFQVLIGQKVAGIPQFSGAGFRTLFLALALLLWIAGTVRHARRIHVATDEVETGDARTFGVRGQAVLGLVIATFAVFVWGVVKLQWDFNQEAALFFVMGVIAGIIGGLGVTGTAEAFVEGFQSMAYAALLIGFARSISTVMEQGLIIDTVVNGLASALGGLPTGLAALGMMGAHAAIHVPVPSVSGQAVLTLPVFAPVADLLHMSRQVAVLAYQYGAGICELITPTNGAMMAVLAAAGVRYDEWIRGAGLMLALVIALGAGAVVLAVATGVT